MTTDTTYQGWTNYETWNVKLWIDNEEGSYCYWRDAAQEAWDDPEENQFIPEREKRAEITLAKRLKYEFDDGADLPELPGPYSDLLNAALQSVNWYEIAASMLEDVDKTDEDEEEDEDE